MWRRRFAVRRAVHGKRKSKRHPARGGGDASLAPRRGVWHTKVGAASREGCAIATLCAKVEADRRCVVTEVGRRYASPGERSCALPAASRRQSGRRARATTPIRSGSQTPTAAYPCMSERRLNVPCPQAHGGGAPGRRGGEAIYQAVVLTLCKHTERWMA